MKRLKKDFLFLITALALVFGIKSYMGSTSKTRVLPDVGTTDVAVSHGLDTTEGWLASVIEGIQKHEYLIQPKEDSDSEAFRSSNPKQCFDVEFEPGKFSIQAKQEVTTPDSKEE